MRWSSAIDSALLVLGLWIWPVTCVRDVPRPVVITSGVSDGLIEGPLVHSGSVRASNTVIVRGENTSRTPTIDVSLHAVVHTGDVLAQYRKSDSEPLAADDAEVVAAEDEVTALRYRLREAEQDYAAQDRLVAEGLATPWQMATLRDAVADVRRDLRTAQSSLLHARLQTAAAVAEEQQAVVRSPVAGIVVAIDPLVPTFQIAADAEHVDVAASLEPGEQDLVQPGDHADVDIAGRRVSGFVQSVEGDEEGGSTAVVGLNIPSHDVPPGTPVTIALTCSRGRTVLRVPNAALSFAPSTDLLELIAETRVPAVPLRPEQRHSSHVWTYQDGVFSVVEVLTGSHDGQFTEIVDGPLRSGDRVVTSASPPASR